jgi:hypothetical protein
MTAAIRCTSGGPPPESTSATSRKTVGPQSRRDHAEPTRSACPGILDLMDLAASDEHHLSWSS